MAKGSRGLRRGLIGVLLLGALMATLVPAAPASADYAGQLVCNAAATVAILPAPPGPGANQWLIAGRGTCFGDFSGTYLADLSAVGTSDTLGLCDAPGTDPTMLNFELAVTLTLTSTSNPAANRVINETWSAPITTFPISVPFLISDGGLMSNNDFVGGGNIFTRIFGRCFPDGSPAGNIYWTRGLYT